MKGLGALADRVQVLFVTLDPERDTAEAMRAYLAHFDPRIVGLRGSRAQTDAAVRAFHLYVRTRAGTSGGDDYSIDHSSFLFLIRPDGSFARLLQAEGSGHALGEALRSELP